MAPIEGRYVTPDVTKSRFGDRCFFAGEFHA